MVLLSPLRGGRLELEEVEHFPPLDHGCPSQKIDKYQVRDSKSEKDAPEAPNTPPFLWIEIEAL